MMIIVKASWQSKRMFAPPWLVVTFMFEFGNWQIWNDVWCKFLSLLFENWEKLVINTPNLISERIAKSAGKRGKRFETNRERKVRKICIAGPDTILIYHNNYFKKHGRNYVFLVKVLLPWRWKDKNQWNFLDDRPIQNIRCVMKLRTIKLRMK
jgi:hypothetical protein